MNFENSSEFNNFFSVNFIYSRGMFSFTPFIIHIIKEVLTVSKKKKKKKKKKMTLRLLYKSKIQI